KALGVLEPKLEGLSAQLSQVERELEAKKQRQTELVDLTAQLEKIKIRTEEYVKLESQQKLEIEKIKHETDELWTRREERRQELVQIDENLLARQRHLS